MCIRDRPCYSLLWRYDEALLEFSRKQEISVIPYSTLAQGLLTGKYQKGAVFTDGRARAALFLSLIHIFPQRLLLASRKRKDFLLPSGP